MLETNTDVDRHLLEQFTADLHDLLARRKDVRETVERIMADPGQLDNYDLLSDLRILEHLGNCITRGIERVVAEDLPKPVEANTEAFIAV